MAREGTVQICAFTGCDRPGVITVRTPNPAVWGTPIYPACGYEHAEKIVQNLLARMFLETQETSSSPAPAAADDSGDEDAG